MANPGRGGTTTAFQASQPSTFRIKEVMLTICNLYDRRGGKRLIRVLALLLALAVAAPVLLAEDSNGDHDNSRVGMLGEFKKKSLVGSWVETFTFVGGPRDRSVGTALVNYNSDGTLIGPQGGPIAFDPDPAKASIISEGAGSWTQTEWNTFVYTSYALFSDFIGNVVGSLKVKGVYHLDLPSRDGYTGHSFYEILDKDLKPVPPSPGSTGFVTNVGKRLTVDLKVPLLPSQP
jgi:hypothetical protein